MKAREGRKGGREEGEGREEGREGGREGEGERNVPTYANHVPAHVNAIQIEY